MLTKKERKTRRNNLLENIFQNIISLITAFLFSTALIGGFGYLLFSQQEEASAVRDEYNQVNLQLEDLKSWDEMLTPVQTGWYSGENPDKLFLILIGLTIAKDEAKLEPSLHTASLQWCLENLHTLSIEKGEIDGITISDRDPLIKSHQETISQLYAEQISVIQSIRDLVTNWESETAISRTNKLNSINDQLNEVSNVFTTVSGQSDQIISAKKTEKAAFEQEIYRLQDSINQIRTRQILAIIGIALGLFGLIGLAIGAKKFYFS